MNRQNVLQLVGPNLENIDFLGDREILKGNYILNGKKLGTYFIDYSDYDPTQGLREYQEKNIAQYYYEKTGAEQWNYYLIFLRNKYEDKKRYNVERDGVYTRKFVFDENELKKYFEYKKSEKRIDSDLVNEWRQKLRNVDLDEVYSDTDYSKAIPRFLENKVIKDDSVDGPFVFGTEDQLIVEKIRTLSLKDTYRSFPKTRDFELGNVNLVRGANGTGKTSFLEAIELIIAGKNMRHPSEIEANGSITATFNDTGILEVYEPNNNQKYRQRDINWYASSYAKGNELYRTFNRYNYFNSDAAYKLEIEGTVSSLSGALSSIAFGPEFSRILKRVNGFQDRLSTEFENRKSVINDARKQIRNAETTIESIGKSEDPSVLFSIFHNYGKEINWRNTLPKEINAGYPEFEAAYNKAQTLINSINRILIAGKLRTYSAINSETNRLTTGRTLCLDIHKRQTDILNRKNKLQSDQKTLVNESDILNKAKRYVLSENSFTLIGLDNRLASLQSGAVKRDSIQASLSEISDQTIFERDISIISFKNTCAENLSTLKQSESAKESQVKLAKSSLTQLETIVSDIKSLGRDYVNLKHNASECPLCEANFPHSELMSRISRTSKAILSSSPIESLEIELSNLKERVTQHEILLKHARILETLASEYFKTIPMHTITFKELKVQIDALIKETDQNMADLGFLKSLKESLLASGLTEQEIMDTKTKLANIFPDYKFEKGSIEELDKLIDQNLGKSSTLATEFEKITSEYKRLEEELSVKLSQIAPTISTQDFDRELSYRIETLQMAGKSYLELRDILEIPDGKDLSEISAQIEELYKHFVSVKNASIHLAQAQLANQIIINETSKITSMEAPMDRLQRALAVIQNILENQNESQVLATFLSNNTSEIQEIFGNIHSPKEFKEILFDQQSNSVMLKRANSEKTVPVNKISTGQRSALALSIFISLNKKLANGPGVLLFDDPVTYTDDLNVLSFLDYLRLMVIKENKQLFFATANYKLAGLFEKKFDFLGESRFKKFNFER